MHLEVEGKVRETENRLRGNIESHLVKSQLAHCAPFPPLVLLEEICHAVHQHRKFLYIFPDGPSCLSCHIAHCIACSKFAGRNCTWSSWAQPAQLSIGAQEVSLMQSATKSWYVLSGRGWRGRPYLSLMLCWHPCGTADPTESSQSPWCYTSRRRVGVSRLSRTAVWWWC